MPTLHRLLTRCVVAWVCTAGWLSSVPAQIQAEIAVDTQGRLATMPQMGLGLHTSPYYNQLGNADVDDRLEESGVTTLRYGGGGYADVLHWSIARPQWESGVIGGGLSPWFGNEGNFGYVGPGSDFASFVQLLDRTENSRAVVTVNYGSALKLQGGQSVVPDYGGQPREAAAWVAYANSDPAIYGTTNDVPLGVDQQGNDWKTAGYWARLRASSAAEYQAWATADGVYEPLNRFLAINREPGLGIEYWEIGNETFGTGYYGGGDGYSVDYDTPYDTNRDGHAALSPARYGQDLREYASWMRAVDPSIKIGAVLATPPDDYSWSYADLNDNGSKDPDEAYWNDEVLANAADEVDFVVVHWYPYIGENSNGANLLSQPNAKIPLMIDGATPGQDAGTSAGLRDTLAQHGVPDAEIMITEFNYFGSLANGVEDAAEALFVADSYASWLERGVTSVQYLELLTKDFLSDSSSLTRGPAFYGVSLVDKLAKPGDAFLPVQSTEDSVSAHAAWQAGGSLAVLLLNGSQSQAEAGLAINGAVLSGSGRQYLLTDGVSLTEAVLTDFDVTQPLILPPRSGLLLVLEATALTPGDFNQDGRVDAADYTVWRDELTSGLPPQAADANQDGVVDSADYLIWRANYSTPFGFGVGETVQAVPCPRAAWLVAVVSLTSVCSRLGSPRTVSCKQ